MKHLLFILTIFIFVSCNNHVGTKPKIFLDEDTMLNVMYDLAILQAVKSTGDYTLADNSLEINSLLFNKYEIDEQIWAENNEYYASNIRKYNKMVNEVLERLEAQKLELEEQSKPKNLKKNEK